MTQDDLVALQDKYKAVAGFSGPYWNEKRRQWYVERWDAGHATGCRVSRHWAHLTEFLDVDTEIARFAETIP